MPSMQLRRDDVIVGVDTHKDLHVAAVVDVADVLRVQITPGPERFRRLRCVEIGLRQPRRANHEFASGFAVFM